MTLSYRRKPVSMVGVDPDFRRDDDDADIPHFWTWNWAQIERG